MKRIIYSKINTQIIPSSKEAAFLLGVSESELLKLVMEADTLYHEIHLQKKDGGVRTINAPKEKLKDIQRRVLFNLLVKAELPLCVYGFGSGKSIIENAEAHKKNEYMFNLDIKDFFPSVHYKKILQLFKELGCSEQTAKVLCKLVTLKYCLPQGAPTSPYLSSLALNHLDLRLFSLAKLNRLTYTRYFDDVTFSGSKRILDIKDTAMSIITSEGYEVKKTKIKSYGPTDEKEITGIIIKTDGSLDVKGLDDFFLYLKELRKFGISRLRSALVEKERQSILGKIAFTYSVNPRNGKFLSTIFKDIKWI